MHRASIHASAGLASTPQHSPAPPHRLAGRPTPFPHSHVLARAARGLPTSHTHTFISQLTTCRESTTGRRLRRLGTRRERRGRPDRGSVPEDEPLAAGRDAAARQPEHDRTPTAHAHALLFLLSLAAHQREPSAGHATKPTTGPLTRSHNKTAYLPSKTVYDRQKLPTDRPPTAHAHSAPRKTADEPPTPVHCRPPPMRRRSTLTHIAGEGALSQPTSLLPARGEVHPRPPIGRGNRTFFDHNRPPSPAQPTHSGSHTSP